MQRISATVGVAVFPGGGEACEDVINAAGRAMYKDKKRHRVANRNFQAVTI
jgi:predicted signal transduction protein with EAL and GGDEF domain